MNDQQKQELLNSKKDIEFEIKQVEFEKEMLLSGVVAYRLMKNLSKRQQFAEQQLEQVNMLLNHEDRDVVDEAKKVIKGGGRDGK